MPDPRLKKPSRKVTHVDEDMRKLVEDMTETMVKYDGVGLAAVQVGVPKRLILVRVPESIEQKLDKEEAEAILAGDDELAKKGILKITVEKADQPDSKPTVTYLRRTVYWPPPTVCINPRIVEKEGLIIDDEGCLSDMRYQAKVERARRVVVAAQDMDMQPIKIEAWGFEARCIQHEIDHLEGILYLDRMIVDTRKCMDGREIDEELEEGECEVEEVTSG